MCDVVLGGRKRTKSLDGCSAGGLNRPSYDSGSESFVDNMSPGSRNAPQFRVPSRARGNGKAGYFRQPPRIWGPDMGDQIASIPGSEYLRLACSCLHSEIIVISMGSSGDLYVPVILDNSTTVAYSL